MSEAVKKDSFDEEACLDFMSKIELAPIDRVNYCKNRIDESRRDSFKNVLKLVSEIGERYCKEHDKHPESVLLNQSIVVINVIIEEIKKLEKEREP